MFYVAPLLFTCLLLWVEQRRTWSRRVAVPAAVAAGALPVVFPYSRFIDTPAMSDTLALLPIWSAFGSLPFGHVWQTVLLGSGIAGLLFVLVPRRFALVVPAVLLAYLSVMSVSVWSGERGFQRSGIGGLFQGSPAMPRGWIDARVPAGEAVAAIHVGSRDPLTIWENEFFNRSVGAVYYLGARTGNVPEEQVIVDPALVVRRVVDGRAITAPYVLVEDSLEINGVPVAKDLRSGMTLWRVAGGRVTTAAVEVEGRYENDTWSGSEVRYRRRGCSGGTLLITLGSDERLFRDTATVVEAFVGGVRVARLRLVPPQRRTMQVPLTSSRGACDVRFTVSPTRRPSAFIAGSADDRDLGAHFFGFTYLP
jgi:hypothetical protein